MSDKLILSFSSDQPPLLLSTEAVFEGMDTLKAWDTSQKSRRAGEFTWGKQRAFRALALVWVKQAMAQAKSGKEEILLASGHLANSIDNLCYKRGRNWLNSILGQYPERLLDKWFDRRNRGGRTKETLLWTRGLAEGAPRLLVEVRVDGLPAGKLWLEELAATLEAGLAEVPAKPLPTPHRTIFLPRTHPEILGREVELGKLDAWLAREAPDPGVLQIVAPGGHGKSGLVRAWIQNLPESLPVFAWSFYRQGYGAEAVQSMRPFFAAAESAWGFKMPSQATPLQMAEALAEAFWRRGGALVLDGLEALGDPRTGRQKHDLLAIFCGAVAGRNRRAEAEAGTRNAKILITTRIPALGKDGEPFPGEQLELPRLSGAAGRKLLGELLRPKFPGLASTWSHAAAEYASGSPLLLRLLVTASRTAGRLVEPWVTGPGSPEGGALERLVASHLEWLLHQPEHALLLMISAYDRPTDTDSLRGLLESGRVLSGEWGAWRPLPLSRWAAAAETLRRVGLVFPGDGLELEVHPLIHACVARRFKSQALVAWQAVHRELRDHFAAAPDAEFPETLEDMEPLIRAVHHGCMAGDYRAAFEEIGWPRISRGPQAYLILALSAPQEALACLAPFHSGGFDFPEDSDLPPVARGAILHAEACALGYLGRTDEALEANRRSLGHLPSRGGVLSMQLRAAALCLQLRLRLHVGPLLASLKILNQLRSVGERLDPAPPAAVVGAASGVGWESLLAFSMSNAVLTLSLAGLRDKADEALGAFLGKTAELGWGILGREGCQYYIGRHLLLTGRWSEVWQAVQEGQTNLFSFAFLEKTNLHELLGGMAQLEGCLAEKLPPGHPMTTSAREWLDRAVTLAWEHGILYRTAETLLHRARWHLAYGNREDFLRDYHQAREYAEALGLRILLKDLAAVKTEAEKKFGTVVGLFMQTGRSLGSKIKGWI